MYYSHVYNYIIVFLKCLHYKINKYTYNIHVYNIIDVH